MSKMRKYKVGQRIKLPAIKSECIPAEMATVLKVPDADGVMLVCVDGCKNGLYNGECEVLTSKRTGRVRSVLLYE